MYYRICSLILTKFLCDDVVDQSWCRLHLMGRFWLLELFSRFVPFPKLSPILLQWVHSNLHHLHTFPLACGLEVLLQSAFSSITREGHVSRFGRCLNTHCKQLLLLAFRAILDCESNRKTSPLYCSYYQNGSKEVGMRPLTRCIKVCAKLSTVSTSGNVIEKLSVFLQQCSGRTSIGLDC